MKESRLGHDMTTFYLVKALSEHLSAPTESIEVREVAQNVISALKEKFGLKSKIPKEANWTKGEIESMGRKQREAQMLSDVKDAMLDLAVMYDSIGNSLIGSKAYTLLEAMKKTLEDIK